MESRLIASADNVEQPDALDEYCPDWRDRLSQGNCLICVVSDGEIAGFGWGREQNELGFTYVDSRLPLERAVFYVYDCYTLSHWRGKGVYQAILKGLAEEAWTDEIYVATRWNNTGSIKGIRKAGFMLDRVFIYFRILGKPVRFHY
ncbi:GNAT family N-acetyltransferase [Marinobacter panjinensis]|nr:GNAT family N-acetyltransferase [Marinobacter panjinensis]MCR8915828.1 GNAT family N-acetyltransferase [Marinobacter panjinensis]